MRPYLEGSDQKATRRHTAGQALAAATARGAGAASTAVRLNGSAPAPRAPSAKAALLYGTAGYLAAYYAALPLLFHLHAGRLIIALLALLCCGLFSVCLGFSNRLWLWLLRVVVYALCILAGTMGGTFTRERAEMQYRYSSLGMESEKIQIYFGRVERDAVPIVTESGAGSAGGFRFIMQLFATSDGKDLLTSAGGRVFVRAKPENPMPGLYELVAVRAPIKSFLSDRDGQVGRRILFSRAPPQSIEIFRQSDLNQSALDVRLDVPLPGKVSPFASKAAAYQTAYATRQTAYAAQGKLLPLMRGYFPTEKHRSFQALVAQKNFAVWDERSKLRRKLFASLRDLFPASGRDLFQVLLLGASEELPEWVKENFRRSGAMHILALSGFHVGILAGLAGFLLRRPLGQSRSLVCSSLILAFYLWLVGPLPSLTRAVLMFLLFNTCKLFLRRADGLCILSISALLQTQLFPASALRLSFQLSYAALLGLICFGGRCNTLALMAHARFLQRVSLLLPPIGNRQPKPDGVKWRSAYKILLEMPHKMLHKVLFEMLPRLLSQLLRLAMQGMAVTLAVLLCSSPILIFQFGRLQWIGILASLVETPLITIYMWLSLCFWPIAHLLQTLGQGSFLTMLQNLYTELYWQVLAPMEFFARVEPWLFSAAENGPILFGPLLLYISLFLAIVAALYRYELRWIVQKLRSK